MKRVFLISVLLLLASSGLTFAVDGLSGAEIPQTGVLQQVGEILLILLVLSVVFEVALTPIFSWRVFLARFEGKGYRTPITVGLAFIVFWGFGLDIIRELLRIFRDSAHVTVNVPKTATIPGQLITALIIAGGSAGVLRIFTQLGIRNPAEVRKKADEAQKALAEKKKRKAEEAERKKAEEAEEAEEAHQDLDEKKESEQTTQDPGS